MPPERTNFVLALVKNNGEERYIFIYDESNLDSLLKQLRKYVDDLELSFDEFDYAILSTRAEQMATQDIVERDESV